MKREELSEKVKFIISNIEVKDYRGNDGYMTEHSKEDAVREVYKLAQQYASSKFEEEAKDLEQIEVNISKLYYTMCLFVEEPLILSKDDIEKLRVDSEKLYNITRKLLK